MTTTGPGPGRVVLSLFSDMSRIGEGTYGVVYKATHRRNGKAFALKKIHLDRDGEGIPSTCMREISLLKEMDHPNIVRLYDVVFNASHDQANSLYMIFEYVDMDLKALCDKIPGKRLPLEYIKGFICQLLRALAYCHTRRILHRDLKPPNLLISENAEVKLADFGLARAFALPSRLYTHEIVTLWYRAPEVLMGCQFYSTGVDLWSTGCIFVELATGQALFRGDSEVDQLFTIFRLLGTPTPETWPGVERMKYYNERFPTWKLDERLVQATIEKELGPKGGDLARQMLEYVPERRLSAPRALSHPFLFDVPTSLPPITSLLARVAAEQQQQQQQQQQ